MNGTPSQDVHSAAGQASAADVLRAAEAFVAGDASVAGELLPHVYGELRRLAGGVIGGPLHGTVHGTISPTVLVHEAFLKLSGRSDLRFASPAAFYAFTASVMRSVLVDHARAAKAQKRGAGAGRVTLTGVLASEAGAAAPSNPEDDAATILALHEALAELAALSERRARVVELRFFAGLSEAQVAEVLGVSRATASSDWRFARAWVLKRMNEMAGEHSPGEA
jgi:RNA polymerase sigma factor (TIGR02999 family)